LFIGENGKNIWIPTCHCRVFILFGEQWDHVTIFICAHDLILFIL